MSAPAPRRGIGHNVAKAALLIAALTVAARVVGFARNLVFSNTVGQTCLGQTYQSTNTIPNIVFEIVAGGALASIVVPLVSGYVGRGDRERAAQVSSALVSWAVLILVPVSILVAVLAEPITRVILGQAPCDLAVQSGAQMLRIFAPQIVLYGIGIVLTGVLQAHRRFAGPAIAPLLSSLVVIGAYVLFTIVAGRGAELGTVSEQDQLILSVGTTLGVVVLSLSLLVPLRGTGVRLRPTLRFPDATAARARALAGAGVVSLLAQQAALAVTLVLANQPQVPRGAINVFVYAQTMFLLPWAIIAVPLATSVYPKLAEAAAAQRHDEFAHDLRRTTTAMLALSTIATAAMAASAYEVARVFVGYAPGEPSVGSMTAGIIGFSAGLVGYSLFALHSRALFALHRAGSNAIAAAAGWGLAIIMSFVLSALLPGEHRVAALTWAQSAGMLLFGLLLVVFSAAAAQRSSAGAAISALGMSVLGFGVGYAVHLIPWGRTLADDGIMGALIMGLIKAIVATAALLAVLSMVPGMRPRQLLAASRGRAPAQPDDQIQTKESAT